MLTVFAKVLCCCLGCFSLPQSPLCVSVHHLTKLQHLSHVTQTKRVHIPSVVWYMEIEFTAKPHLLCITLDTTACF